MYLDTTVEIPEKPGKIVIQKKGDSYYVHYEYARVYDEKRKLIPTLKQRNLTTLVLYLLVLKVLTAYFRLFACGSQGLFGDKTLNKKCGY